MTECPEFILKMALNSKIVGNENIAKGTTDPRVEFISQVAHKS